MNSVIQWSDNSTMILNKHLFWLIAMILPDHYATVKYDTTSVSTSGGRDKQVSNSLTPRCSVVQASSLPSKHNIQLFYRISLVKTEFCSLKHVENNRKNNMIFLTTNINAYIKGFTL